MERITIRGQHGIFVKPSHDFGIDPDDYDRVQEILARLAAYEDTGLKPSICAEYKKFEDEAVAKGVPFSRIIELMEAEKNGHLRVLPAALGETVYYADEDAGRVMMGYINGYQIRVDGLMSFEFFNLELDVEWHSIALPIGEFGKTVFLTQEEAEKVLEGTEEKDEVNI